jgi:predicted nucleotidyltransferase
LSLKLLGTKRLVWRKGTGEMETEREKTMAERREQALAVIEVCARLLQGRFGARRVIPFGSVVAPGRWHERSDIDLAVEGLDPALFWQVWASLEDLLPRGLSVDLVSLELASPELRARILGGRPVADNPLEALRGIVADELTALERVQQRVASVLETLPEEPGHMELMALAGYVHGFYTGVESIFERLAVGLGEGIPRGEYWHVDLLNQMADPQAGRRPAVIDEPLRARLREYLRFRHFFRHAYDYAVEWRKLRPLVEGMGRVLVALRAQIETFLGKMTEGIEGAEEPEGAKGAEEPEGAKGAEGPEGAKGAEGPEV